MVAKRRSLGRGLEALLGDLPQTNEKPDVRLEGELRSLPISNIQKKLNSSLDNIKNYRIAHPQSPNPTQNFMISNQDYRQLG